ncbi:MAG TPA: hypothetical protein G4O16_07960 [Dehalococcoidia bacterium]|nr:hypothetical protein [Dehalococcoidia bacterium]
MSPNTKKLNPLLVTKEEKAIPEKLSTPISLFLGVILGWVLYSVFGNEGYFDVTIYFIVLLIALPLIFFIFPGKNHIALYEEGIQIRAGVRRILYEWDSFQSFTADKTKGRFSLKRKGFGSIILISRKNYPEVEKILLERISPRQ